MSLNRLAVWSAVLKGSLWSIRKPKKSSPAFTNFWSRFGVTGLGLKSVNFLCCYAASTNQCSEVSLSCVYWYYFPLHVQHWSHFHIRYIKQSLHLSRIPEWIWIIEFHTISLLLWWSWLWIVAKIFWNILILDIRNIRIWICCRKSKGHLKI